MELVSASAGQRRASGLATVSASPVHRDRRRAGRFERETKVASKQEANKTLSGRGDKQGAESLASRQCLRRVYRLLRRTHRAYKRLAQQVRADQFCSEHGLPTPIHVVGSVQPELPKRSAKALLASHSLLDEMKKAGKELDSALQSVDACIGAIDIIKVAKRCVRLLPRGGDDKIAKKISDVPGKLGDDWLAKRIEVIAPLKELWEEVDAAWLLSSSAAVDTGPPGYSDLKGKEAAAEPVAKRMSEKRVTTDDLMKAELAANLDEVRGLTAKRWAALIGRSETAVKTSKTWKDLQLLREREKASKRLDRSKNCRR